MCFVVLVHVVHVFKSWLICITWLCLRPSSWPLLMFMIVSDGCGCGCGSSCCLIVLQFSSW